MLKTVRYGIPPYRLVPVPSASEGQTGGYRVKIINVSPHPLNFLAADGQEFEVPPCGVVISATALDEPAGTHPSGAELVRVRFTASAEANSQLDKLEEENPGAIIVGSMIAAQAFPGRVVGMIAAPGYERRPPAEKRMRLDRFTTFNQEEAP